MWSAVRTVVLAAALAILLASWSVDVQARDLKQTLVQASSLLNAAENGPCYSVIEQAVGSGCGGSGDGALELSAGCCNSLAAVRADCWAAMRGVVINLVADACGIDAGGEFVAVKSRALAQVDDEDGGSDDDGDDDSGGGGDDDDSGGGDDDGDDDGGDDDGDDDSGGDDDDGDDGGGGGDEEEPEPVPPSEPPPEPEPVPPSEPPLEPEPVPPSEPPPAPEPAPLSEPPPEPEPVPPSEPPSEPEPTPPNPEEPSEPEPNPPNPEEPSEPTPTPEPVPPPQQPSPTPEEPVPSPPDDGNGGGVSPPPPDNPPPVDNVPNPLAPGGNGGDDDDDGGDDGGGGDDDDDDDGDGGDTPALIPSPSPSPPPPSPLPAPAPAPAFAPAPAPEPAFAPGPGPGPAPAPAPGPEPALAPAGEGLPDDFLQGLSVGQLAALLEQRQQDCLTEFDLALNTTCASQDVAPCCESLGAFGPACLGYIATTMADEPSYKHANLFGPFNETLGICRLAVDPYTAFALNVGSNAGEAPPAPPQGDCTSQLATALGVCTSAAADRLSCCSELAELGPGCLDTLETIVADDAELAAGFASVLDLCNLGPAVTAGAGTVDTFISQAADPTAAAAATGAPTPFRRMLRELPAAARNARAADNPLFDAAGWS